VKINSNINILGGMPDFNLIEDYLPDSNSGTVSGPSSAIRTRKSVDRFEKAIRKTFYDDTDNRVVDLLVSTIKSEGISDDCLLMLFLTASANNELLDYLNRQVYFPALYSGRTVIKSEEVLACLKELKAIEPALNKWSDYTLELTASKYLTLIKKFGLLEGASKKTIRHPFLSDKAFVLVIYWMLAVETSPEILGSKWFTYSFNERNILVDRIRQNRFSKFLEIKFTGDKLKVEPLIDYKDIYYVLTQSQSDNQ